MEKIEILLEKLDNRIPSSLAKRIDTVDNLQEKIEATAEEYEANPTDDNRKSYNETMNYVENLELGIIKDLEALLTKRKAEELAKETPATPPVVETPLETPPATPSAKSEEKKEGSGALTLVIGGILLVASFGAINYFRKQ
jgi:hypothetical protein